MSNNNQKINMLRIQKKGSKFKKKHVFRQTHYKNDYGLKEEEMADLIKLQQSKIRDAFDFIDVQIQTFKLNPRDKLLKKVDNELGIFLKNTVELLSDNPQVQMYRCKQCTPKRSFKTLATYRVHNQRYHQQKKQQEQQEQKE